MKKEVEVEVQSNLVVVAVSNLEEVEEEEEGPLLKQVDDMVGMQGDMLVDSRSLLQEEVAPVEDKVLGHASRCQHCFCVSWREDRLQRSSAVEEEVGIHFGHSSLDRTIPEDKVLEHMVREGMDKHEAVVEDNMPL